MSEEVDNQYRLALEDELPALRGHASIPSFAYYSVQEALRNHAWQSSTADAFSTALNEHDRLAGTDGNDCEAAFESRYQHEPERVPADDPRAHWQ